jgi:hypothetical protein
MRTIVSMSMIVYTAGAVVYDMRYYNQDNGGYHQPGFIMNKKQF